MINHYLFRQQRADLLHWWRKSDHQVHWGWCCRLFQTQSLWWWSLGRLFKCTNNGTWHELFSTRWPTKKHLCQRRWWGGWGVCPGFDHCFNFQFALLNLNFSFQGDWGTVGSAYTPKTSFSKMTQVMWCHPICHYGLWFAVLSGDQFLFVMAPSYRPSQLFKKPGPLLWVSISQCVCQIYVNPSVSPYICIVHLYE